MFFSLQAKDMPQSHLVILKRDIIKSLCFFGNNGRLCAGGRLSWDKHCCIIISFALTTAEVEPQCN